MYVWPQTGFMSYVKRHLSAHPYNLSKGIATLKGGKVNPFRKAVYSRMKEFVPSANIFFPFMVDPFQKWIRVKENKQEVTKVDSL